MGGTNLECDVAGLYRWIDNYQLTRQKRNISRDFSDAVPLAEILKHHYPRLVELHNYSPKNSVSQKLVNWETLNKKVLSKLDMSLSNSVMEEIARAVPGAIEKVLFDVKARIDNKHVLDKPPDNGLLIEGLSSSLSGSVTPIIQKNGTKPLNHKVVAIDTLTKLENELEEKGEAIYALQNKLQHLESLLAIKEERIKDLTKQLQQLSSQSSTSSLTTRGSKFFQKLF